MPNEVQNYETVRGLVERMTPAFAQAMGDKKMAERFARVALTEIRKNPKLASCDSMSLMGGLMMSAQLSLDFGLGSAFLIPYWNSGRSCYEAVFQIGYQGWIELFFRHSLAQELYAEAVYANDKFSITKGTNRAIAHEPAVSGDRGAPIGFYGVARLKTGAMNFVYMTKDEMDAHRDRYVRKDKKGSYGVWDDEYEMMALKTVIKKVLKYMPRSAAMSAAVSYDDGMKRITEKEVMQIDAVPVVYPELEAPNDEGVKASDETPASKTTRGRPKTEKAKPEKDEVPMPNETEQVPDGIDPFKAARMKLIDDISNSFVLTPQQKDEFVAAVRTCEHIADIYSVRSQFKLAENEHAE